MVRLWKRRNRVCNSYVAHRLRYGCAKGGSAGSPLPPESRVGSEGASQCNHMIRQTVIRDSVTSNSVTSNSVTRDREAGVA